MHCIAKLRCCNIPWGHERGNLKFTECFTATLIVGVLGQLWQFTEMYPNMYSWKYFYWFGHSPFIHRYICRGTVVWNVNADTHAVMNFRTVCFAWGKHCKDRDCYINKNPPTTELKLYPLSVRDTYLPEMSWNLRFIAVFSPILHCNKAQHFCHSDSGLTNVDLHYAIDMQMNM